MPRYYNPENSDFTLWVAQKLQYIFFDKSLSLTEEETIKAINYFNKEGIISSISNPALVIKNDCSRGHYFFDSENRINRYFPIMYIPNKHKIIVCKNLISNNVQLLSNLKRELYLADLYDQFKIKDDENLACATFKACKKGLDVYNEPIKAQKASMICAKLLLRYRGINEDDLPMDAWIRLTDKMVKYKQYCYNDQFGLN